MLPLHLSSLPPFLVSLLLLTTQPTRASFFPPETRRPLVPIPPSSTSPASPATSQRHNLFNDLIDLANNTLLSLAPRGDVPCAGTPCGYYGQVCCGAGQACYTNALTQAACSYAVGATNVATGYWSYYTSTNTQTITQVYSTWIPVATPAQTTTLYVPLVAQTTTTQVAVVCATSLGETGCGGICCSNGQYCVPGGWCTTSNLFVAVTTTTTATAGTAGVPLRVTSSTLRTVATSINPTTTEGFLPAIATGNVTLTQMSASSGLSGGAIAGIVIGVIAAIILLMLLCLFLCFKSVWDAIFGGGGRDRRQGSRRKVTTEEWGGGYRQHGSRTDARSDYQGYGGYGGGGGRPQRPQRSRKDNSGGGGFGVAALLAGLAGIGAGLSFGRKKNEQKSSGRRRQEKSESDYTDDSSYLTRSVEEERVFRNGRGE